MSADLVREVHDVRKLGHERVRPAAVEPVLPAQHLHLFGAPGRVEARRRILERVADTHELLIPAHFA